MCLCLQLETWTALFAILFFLGFIFKESIMGGKSSKEEGRRHVSSSYGNSRWDGYGYPQSPRPQQSPYYQPHPSSSSAPAPFYEYGSHASSQPTRRLDRKYSKIADDYRSLDEVS